MNTTIALTLAVLSISLWGCASKDYAPIGTIDRIYPKMNKLISANTTAEKLAGGYLWSEGPVWVKQGQFLLFTDIPNNRVEMFKEGEGRSDTFLFPAGYTGATPRGGELGANGLIIDPKGRLVLCQHGDRRVARLTNSAIPDLGVKREFITLADRYEGQRFNSPNDLIYHSNGDLYFTDPPYGLEKRMDDPNKELNFQGVYVLRGGGLGDTGGGKVELLTKELSRPNGIAFSPDEKFLYVANSDPDRAIWMKYPVNADGTIGQGSLFFDATDKVKAGELGLPDGMAVDVHGNIFATGPGGVLIFTPDGTHLGTIKTGHKTANCAFGGKDGDVLYMTAHTLLLKIETNTIGLGFPRD